MRGDGWSEWIYFEKRNVRRAVPESIHFGAYRNRLVGSDGVAVPIAHPLGTDDEGIVYIGAAGVITKHPHNSHMQMRFRKHVYAHLGAIAGQAGNEGGRKLIRLWEKIRAVDGGARMQFQYIALPTAGCAAVVEGVLLESFRAKFGEDPDDLWCEEQRHPFISALPSEMV